MKQRQSEESNADGPNFLMFCDAYTRSHFTDRDFVPDLKWADPSARAQARQEYIADPIAVLAQNIEQASDDVRETAKRLNRAREHGMLDRVRYKAAGSAEREKWLKALNLVRGDYHRAVGELAQWRKYVQLMADGKLPMPRENFDPVELARSKSLEPDRAPIEDDCPF